MRKNSSNLTEILVSSSNYLNVLVQAVQISLKTVVDKVSDSTSSSMNEQAVILKAI